MPVDYAEAAELLQEGTAVAVPCAYCDDLVWSHKAAWTGVKPYHPTCHDQLADDVLEEMLSEIDE